MQTFQADLAIVDAGSAGSHAAIAVAQADLNIRVALTSKIYPMRSHTVVAEGGSVAVAQDYDSFKYHSHDTVAGGGWLRKQDVVDYLVHHCPTEVTQLKLWGCPWSRRPDGSINVRRFDGMRTERAWFAADETNSHMLYTLFQTSLQFPQIRRSDECFVLSILVDDGRVHGLVVMNTVEGTLVRTRTNVVAMATDGAGRAYCYNTNSGTVTGDGMGMALSHSIPLRNTEFVQHHPADLPGSGTLTTEDCRGEGDILVNKNGYRHLQNYGMGPETPLDEPKNKYMELGPCDKVSQAFWHKQRKGNTISTPCSDVVYLDLRHLGGRKLHERLPFICELAKAYVSVDPVKEPIPVHPTTHYTVGDIETDQNYETRIKNLSAVGECSLVGLHGADRPGSNSPTELVVFGRPADEQAAERIVTAGNGNEVAIEARVADAKQRPKDLVSRDGGESQAKIRDEMGMTIEGGCDIYRMPGLMQKIIDKLAELQEHSKHIRITDTSNVFNIDLLYTIELDHGLNIAECMVHSTMARKKLHGAYQRLDEGCTEHDDVNFLKHAFAFHDVDDTTHLEYSDMKTTTLSPVKRTYGGEAGVADRAEAANKKEKANG